MCFDMLCLMINIMIYIYYYFYICVLYYHINMFIGTGQQKPSIFHVKVACDTMDVQVHALKTL